MGRELTAPITAAVAQTVTLPGYLLRVEMPTQIIRISSRGDVTWKGELYVARGLRVDGIEQDAETGIVAGRVTIDDADKAYTALVLTDGVADRAMSLWQFYGDGPTIPRFDPIPLVTGVGDEAQIDINSATVSISLNGSGGVTQFAPRHYITSQEGFSLVPPSGTIIEWAGERYKLEGAR